jgi:DNA-binding transcriptional ArsR family regulator
VTDVDHPHPVDIDAVMRAGASAPNLDEAERLSRLLGLLADPVRSRLLFALVSVPELCVGDLGLALGVTVDQVSYALKMLRTSGLVQSRRDGRVIFYRLADDFPHQLLEHCLRQLLAITSRAGY